jgi:hypothetical protein
MNDSVISKIAEAIAFAEGYFVSGSRPLRNNNPGDVERDVTGKGAGWDGPYVIYATSQDGREALEHQVRLMFGGCRIYKASMTIAEVARRYTATDPAGWARTVAGRLGVTVDTRLDEIEARAKDSADVDRTTATPPFPRRGI